MHEVDLRETTTVTVARFCLEALVVWSVCVCVCVGEKCEEDVVITTGT